MINLDGMLTEVIATKTVFITIKLNAATMKLKLHIVITF